MADEEQEQIVPDDTPFILNTTATERVYMEYEEYNDEGDVEKVKLRATKEFKLLFNKAVHDLLINCIQNARREGRKALYAEDVPKIEIE